MSTTGTEDRMQASEDPRIPPPMHKLPGASYSGVQKLSGQTAADPQQSHEVQLQKHSGASRRANKYTQAHPCTITHTQRLENSSTVPATDKREEEHTRSTTRCSGIDHPVTHTAEPAIQMSTIQPNTDNNQTTS